MIIGQFGCRRLYDAVECALSDGSSEYKADLDIGNFYVQLYIGDNPIYGIDLTTIDSYVVPGSTIQLPFRQYKNVSESGYPRKFFTEITCWRKVDPSENAVIPHAFNDAEATSLLDNIAGVIGLKFHSQLVFKLICENIVAHVRKGAPGEHGFNFVKQGKFHVVQPVKINPKEFRDRLSVELERVMHFA